MGHFIRHIVEIYSAIVAIPSFLLGMWVSRIIGKIRRRRVSPADQPSQAVNG